MGGSKQNGDLYRVVKKEGTHLAESKETPGAVRGTLLSNDNRQLAGQAEFIKVDEDEYDYSYSPYAYEDEREPIELTEEQRQMAAMLGDAAAEVIIRLLVEAAPHVKNWWQEKVAPNINRTWQGLLGKTDSNKIHKKPQLRATEILAKKESVPSVFSQELDDAYSKYANDMTSEEAQRELLDIFILSSVVVAKMRKLARSHIVKAGSGSSEYIEGKDVIAKLSTPQFINSINSILKNNPNLLEERSVPISAILGRSLVVDGCFLPIDNEALRAAFADAI